MFFFNPVDNNWFRSQLSWWLMFVCSPSSTNITQWTGWRYCNWVCSCWPSQHSTFSWSTQRCPTHNRETAPCVGPWHLYHYYWLKIKKMPYIRDLLIHWHVPSHIPLQKLWLGQRFGPRSCSYLLLHTTWSLIASMCHIHCTGVFAVSHKKQYNYS